MLAVRDAQIVRMYKRMAEAGYLAKEPGMGAADIAKAHERSVFRHAWHGISSILASSLSVKVDSLNIKCLHLL